MSRSSMLAPPRVASWLYGIGACILAFGPVAAEPVRPGDDPVTAIMKWRPTTPDPEVQDFVRASRPANGALDYEPLSRPKVARPTTKTKDGLKDTLKEMDARSAALHRRAGVTASAGPATARKLEAAAVESRRRARDDFTPSKTGGD